MTTAGAALPFRPDIEGLRAVAILLVVAAHAGVPGLPGGFVGVDAFFVLSGYLITRLLAHDSRPRLREFYAARLRRLLPALLLVFFATVLASALLLAPMEQGLQAGVAQAVPLWLTNLALAAREVSYFGPAAETIVFQHAWSLALEEQFYLAWPLVVLVAIGAWRARTPSQGAGQGRALAVLALVLAGSLAWCIFDTARAPVAAYYLLPARSWQFALGGCLAIAFDPALGGRPGRFGQSVGIAGAALLLSAAVMLDGQDPYPGWRALWPSLGTAGLVYAGLSTSAATTRLLSTLPMQWLGRQSYGWYLWHWPVLLLGITLVPAPGLATGLALALAALALAALSHRWVESPIRHAAGLRRRPGLTMSLAAAAMLVAWLVAQAWGDWAREAQEGATQRRSLLVTIDQSIVYRQDCDDFHRPLREVPCSFGPASAPRTLAVIGDSVGLQWFPALQVAHPASQWRIVVFTRSACPMLDEAPDGLSASASSECAQWRDAVVAALARLRPERAIVGSADTYGFDADATLRGTRDFMRRVAAHATTTVLLEPTPRLGFDAPACLARAAWRGSLGIPALACRAAWQPPVAERAARHIALDEIGNALHLDLNDLVCPGNVCEAERDGVAVYRDSLHLTATFAASIAPEVGARLSATTR